MKKIGFSLVEILVVLVIIGILVGLILPNALTAIRRANEKECAANIRAIQTAIHSCYTQTRDGTTCDSAAVAAQMDGGALPTCPFGVAYAVAAGANAATLPTITNIAAHFATWPTGAHQ